MTALAHWPWKCSVASTNAARTLKFSTSARPGFDLAPYLYAADLVVIADAVHAQEKPGTLCIYCEDDLLARRAQLRLTAHDPGVRESLALLKLAGHAPSEVIIVGVVPESCDLGKGFSPSVLSTSSVQSITSLACWSSAASNAGAGMRRARRISGGCLAMSGLSLSHDVER